MGWILQALPTAVIVGCTIVAMVLIGRTPSGSPRTLGLVGMLILMLGSIGGVVYALLLPLMFDRLGSAMASLVGAVHSAVSAGIYLLGMALVVIAVIFASRSKVVAS